MTEWALADEPKLDPPASTPPTAPASVVIDEIGRHLLFVGDVGDAVRRTDAEIDDAVGRQLERGAARDDLALVEIGIFGDADRR